MYFVSCLPAQCPQRGDVADIYSAIWRSEPPTVRFRRGDCNDDGAVNLSDAACVLNWLFAGAETPGCFASLNTNGDTAVDIADPVYLINFLFAGGPSLSAPYPDCGPGELPADECANPPPCE